MSQTELESRETRRVELTSHVGGSKRRRVRRVGRVVGSVEDHEGSSVEGNSGVGDAGGGGNSGGGCWSARGFGYIIRKRSVREESVAADELRTEASHSLCEKKLRSEENG